MADLVDDADSIIEGANGRAIAAAQARVKGTGTKDCVDCFQPIPKARRKAMPNANRCITCAEFLELEQKGR